jgi:hypothetical protein
LDLGLDLGLNLGFLSRSGFLARLVTGDIALWRLFWLIGLPLGILWDVTGLCMVLGIGVEQPLVAGLIIGLFTLASIAMPFVALGTWRSASNYPRQAWWQTPLAWAAKACAVGSGLIGVLSVIGLLYLAVEFIEAFFAPD